MALREAAPADVNRWRQIGRSMTVHDAGTFAPADRRRNGPRVSICSALSVRIRQSRSLFSKDAFEDEHPPAGHQMLQSVRQGLDP